MTKTERTCPRCGLVFVSDKLDGLCPACLLTNTLDLEEHDDGQAFWEDDKPATSLGRAFSHFEIIEELGRGGMGTVYRARDHVTGRIVALKVLQAHHLDEPDLVQRFRSEVRAVTSLDHRNILPIHEVGEHDGIPFFSMKLATGGSLAFHLGDYLGQPRKAALLVAKIARGVQHAHEHGILHRDLKPGNILLDDEGEPYVCDFGLAKWLDDDRRLTVTSAVLGTPHYIAPEQASGKQGLTIAADIYSLGAILYELLTGRPPFVGETVIDTLRQASECSPAKPSSIVSHTPRDLETICLKCLEREPVARYRTAVALADDLENWIAGRPIHARPVSAAEQLWRWARRNPLPATLGAILLIALTTLAFGATIAAIKIDKSRSRAVAAEHDAREQLYASLLAQARASRMTGQAGHRIDALAALKKAAAIRPSLELRNEAIAALTLVDLDIAKKFKVRESPNQRLAFDARIETVAVATKDGDIALISLADGRIQKTLTGVGKPILSLVHSGSRYLAARGNDDTIYIWDLAAGIVRSRYAGHPSPRQPSSFPSDFVFSADERLLALGSPQGIQVIDIETGREIVRLDAAQPAVIAFDSTSGRVAFGTANEASVAIWDYSGHRPLVSLPLPSEPRSLAWSPDSDTLAIGCADFSILLVDPAAGKIRHTLTGHRQEITEVTFNHTGDMLASNARDRTIRLWDLRTITELVALPKYGTEPAMRFSPDDRQLSATDGQNAATIAAVVGVNRVCIAFATPFAKEEPSLVGSMDYSRDSQLLATASTGALCFFDAKKGRPLLTQPISPMTQTSVRFLPDGKTLAVASRRAGLKFRHFSFADGKLELEAGNDKELLPGYLLGSAQYPVSPYLCLTSTRDAQAVVIDPSNGQIVRSIPGQSSIWDMVISPDKKWIATSYASLSDHTAQIWSFTTGQHVFDLPGGLGGIIGFSPSGRWLACSGTGADHVLWNTGTWSKGPALPPQVEDETGRFAFSDDETLFAASLVDQISLVSLPNGELLAALEQHLQPNPLCRLRFSPDGNQLAAQGADNSLSLWNLDELRKELRELNLLW